jgi:hypothetical protein
MKRDEKRIELSWKHGKRNATEKLIRLPLNIDMKAALAIAIVGAFGLYQASEWWERAFANYESSLVSPDGCFRIDSLRPFWVLPSIFHLSPHPDPTIQNSFGQPWENAIFRRAVELSTGEVLGETVVFDPVAPAPLIFWNEPAPPGRRIVYANQFLLFDSERCADVATLTKLQAHRARKQQESSTSHENQEAEYDRISAPLELNR